MDQIENDEPELELKDKYLRALANLDNLQKRTRKDIEAARDQGETSILLEMLPIIDDFRRALEADLSPDVSSDQKHEGWDLVFRKFGNTLGRLGVVEFESVGKKFNAELMEAVSQVPTSHLLPGTVVGEVERGYKRGDKLLRAARVAVASPDIKEEGHDEA